MSGPQDLTSTIRPLQRPAPLRQSVYDALIDLIVGGDVLPGQHIVETDLARQLGVSRQPIREALHRMEAEGWVDLRPSQGAFVHVPTDAEMDELFQARAMLDAEIARRAAGNATREQADRLREIHHTQLMAAEASDFAAAISADMAFNREITTIAGNSVLADLANIVNRRVHWYLGITAPAVGQGFGAELGQLTDAIEAGDAELAEVLARRYIRRFQLSYTQAEVGRLDGAL
jgi:DNA-binding GntR family transcriptional regulator